MVNELASRVQRIQPSPTLAVAARADELKAAGKNIISLSVGEPDFDTPDHIKEAAIRAIREGYTKYTAVDGMKSLKQAIVDKFARENNLNYSLNQILVSCGAKHSIFNLFCAMLNAGDEVIILAPYWVSYPDIAKLADAVPVVIMADYDQNFKITPAQLEAAITPKTRLIMLNSPSNPTGVTYTAAELKALADVLMQYPEVLVASDDIYEHTVWSKEPFTNILMVCPALYDRCVVINGVSKAYSMTGWRIGYAAGPARIINAMTKIQSQSTSNATSISQVAAQAALSGDQTCITIMTEAFKERHDFVLGELLKIPGVRCAPCDGTFYIFPCFNDLIGKTLAINNDIELAEYLLNEAEIALIPGSAFGAEGYLRISYATSMDKLVEAMKRMQAAIAKLQ
jgi:aspartate aminotransferase